MTQALPPISRTALVRSDGDDHDLFRFVGVQQATRELSDLELSELLAVRRADLRKRSDVYDRPLDRRDESIAKITGHTIVVGDPFEKLRISLFDKSVWLQDLRARARAKTSSPGTADIRPDLKSSYLDSASSSQSVSISASERSSKLSRRRFARAARAGGSSVKTSDSISSSFLAMSSQF